MTTTDGDKQLQLGVQTSVLPLALISEVDGADTYVCEAAPGVASSAAKWRCYKVTVSGNTTTTTWADGDTNFDNVADDRKTLSYS